MLKLKAMLILLNLIVLQGYSQNLKPDSAIVKNWKRINYNYQLSIECENSLIGEKRKNDSLNSIISYKDTLEDLLYNIIVNDSLALRQCTARNNVLEALASKQQKEISEYKKYVNLPLLKKMFKKKTVIQ